MSIRTTRMLSNLAAVGETGYDPHQQTFGQNK